MIEKRTCESTALKEIVLTLDRADFLAWLNGTELDILDAPGEGKAIEFVQGHYSFKHDDGVFEGDLEFSISLCGQTFVDQTVSLGGGDVIGGGFLDPASNFANFVQYSDYASNANAPMRAQAAGNPFSVLGENAFFRFSILYRIIDLAP